MSGNELQQLAYDELFALSAKPSSNLFIVVSPQTKATKDLITEWLAASEGLTVRPMLQKNRTLVVSVTKNNGYTRLYHNDEFDRYITAGIHNLVIHRADALIKKDELFERWFKEVRDRVHGGQSRIVLTAAIMDITDWGIRTPDVLSRLSPAIRIDPTVRRDRSPK